VRIPKGFRFDDDEVVIKKVGDAIMLFPKRYSHGALKEALGELEPDFQVERHQPAQEQERDFDD
jgi:antitoxin VapB